LFAFCDHYEPLWGGASESTATARVRAWEQSYPLLASGFRDADGRSPRHTFFFPGEEYRPHFMDALGNLARKQLGEVEVHLHHDFDTKESLAAKLEKAISDFTAHGHISRASDGKPQWSFIHGNWALANGRRDGRWCGVDDELPLLHQLGCYADYTFPSAPDECQPNIVNQIYWPSGDLKSKRCYEHGTRARVGHYVNDRLLMIQGPLALARRPGSLRVRIESSAVTAKDPATASRLKAWTRTAIHVAGRPEWVFVKVHTHGAPEREATSLLHDGGTALHRQLTTHYNDGHAWQLHYVTAREMYNIAIAAMDGFSGDPFVYRNHVVAPPAAAT
jgi:hypothetical protein